MLVILPGERFTKPVLVETVPADGLLEVRISALVDETVTVTAGTAPDIEATMANATTLLPSREIQNRQPANLTQALETVAGVSTVSEGHAAVPAIRGLARGRTLILLDGARVTSDRRVGPSATFLDPFVLDAASRLRAGRARWPTDPTRSAASSTRARAASIPRPRWPGAWWARWGPARLKSASGRRSQGPGQGRRGAAGPLPEFRRLPEPAG